MRKLICLLTAYIVFNCLFSTEAVSEESGTGANFIDASCYKYDAATDSYYWDGFRCMVDQNQNGQIDDCSEMLLCSKPQSIGICQQSPEPIGYKCLSTQKIYMPLSSAQGIEGINQSDIIDTPLDQALQVCQTYDPITHKGCPELKCSAIYNYTCTGNNKTYISGELCQNDCGARCRCVAPGIYDFDDQICYIESKNPCPEDMSYDPVLNSCIAYPYCPEGTSLNPDTNTCESSEVLFCPSNTIYNPDTGRCQKFPDCPYGTLYMPDTDVCVVASCPSQYQYDARMNLCLRDNDCPPYGSFNPETRLCEHPIGRCNPENLQLCSDAYPNCSITDYIKIFIGSAYAPPFGKFFNQGEISITNTVNADKYNLNNWLCKGSLKQYVKSNKADVYLYYARPYRCSRTDVLYDKQVCDNLCPCYPGYSPQDPICIKNPCKAAETLTDVPHDPYGVQIDPPRYMCAVPPTVWASEGICPPGVNQDNNIYYQNNAVYSYNPVSGLCEKPPDCRAVQQWQYGYYYDAQLNVCYTTGQPTCPSGYSSDSQGNCVANPICPSGMTFNPDTMRCEKSVTCPEPLQMTNINGVFYCAYSVPCTEADAIQGFGTWNTVWAVCKDQGAPVCQNPYRLYNNFCYSPIQCPQGTYPVKVYSPSINDYVNFCYRPIMETECASSFTRNGSNISLCSSATNCLYNPSQAFISQGCRANLECKPPGTLVTGNYYPICSIPYNPPSNWRDICIARGDNYSLASVWQGYCLRPPICSQYNLITSAYWIGNRVEYNYYCGYLPDTCLPGFFQSSNNYYCIMSPPPCEAGTTYNSTTNNCEMPMVLQCPPGFNQEGNQYCWINPVCPEGSIYDPAIDQCRMNASGVCPVAGLQCDPLNQCYETATCNSIPVTITVTGPTDILALQIISFSKVSDSVVRFIQVNNTVVDITFSGCTVTEAHSTSLSGLALIEVSDGNITFKDQNQNILGLLSFSDCTVSFSNQSVTAIYGPLAGNNNTLEFFSAVLTLTTDRTQNVCPIDQSLPCDASNMCTKVYQCTGTCPAGMSYNSNLNSCVAQPTCTGGAIFSASVDRCVLENLDPQYYSCPSGYQSDTSRKVCYKPPVCPSGSTFINGPSSVYSQDCCYYQRCNGTLLYLYGVTPPGTYCLNDTWVQCYFRDDELYGFKSFSWYPLNACMYIPAEFNFVCPPEYDQFNPADRYMYVNGYYVYVPKGCYGTYTTGAYKCPDFPPDAEQIVSTMYSCSYSPHITCPDGYNRCYYNQNLCYLPGTSYYVNYIDGCVGPRISNNNFQTFCPSIPSYPYPYVYIDVGNSNCGYRPQLDDLNCPQGYHPLQYIPTEVLINQGYPGVNPYNPWVYYSPTYGYQNADQSFNCFKPVGRSDCPSIANGFLIDNTNKIVYCTNSQGCPLNTQYDATYNVCYSTPTCPQNGILDPDLKKCKTNAISYTCPQGYILIQGTNRCHSSPYCKDAVLTSGQNLPGIYSPERDVCFVCPEGFKWDSTLNTCVSEPSCPDGMMLNKDRDVCESIMQLLCSGSAMYDPQTGKCKSAPQCPSGQCSVNGVQGCYNTTTQKCDTSQQPPCNVNMYDSTLKICIVPGSPECPEPYIFNAAKMRCEYPPECPPTDWVCPVESEDPICGNNSPFIMKTYIANASTGAISTAAITINKVDLNNYHSLASLGFSPDLSKSEEIWTRFGSGPFWIKDGILYKDVYFQIENLNDMCYYYLDFNNQDSSTYWRPKGLDITIQCPINSQEAFYHWEKVHDTCICRTYSTKIYQVVCTNPSTGAYNEQFVSETFSSNPDLSVTPAKCIVDINNKYVCSKDTYGLNECDLNKVTYSSDTQLCGGVAIPKSKSVVTCADGKPAYAVIETRDVDPFNRGVVYWDHQVCNPCFSYTEDLIETQEVDTPDPMPPGVMCNTSIKVFSGMSKRCRSSGIETIFTNCCSMSGWFTSWCKSEEKELKKRKETRVCHEVGEYCSKKIGLFNICVQKKKSYCCFSSKLARIIQEQGRPMLGKGWGSGENPDCSGFLPEDFSRLDFSRMDFSEYLQDINKQVSTGTSDAQMKALEGMQEWFSEGAQNTSPSQIK